MKIIREAHYEWDGTKYVKTYEDACEYLGPVAKLCGPSADQTSIMNTQMQLTQQAQQQSQAIFGSASTVFGDLMKSFAPIVAAGPNQQGYSAQENDNLMSQAVTQGGVAYRNAKTAVGNAEAAVGGGNTPLPSGAQIGTQANIAASAAENTANTESEITTNNYAQGEKNYEQAVGGMEEAPGVFGAATGAVGTASNVAGSAANTANTINQQDTAWQTAAIGALGSVAGAAAKGGFSGGSGSNGVDASQLSYDTPDFYGPTPNG
jgi:hypothetical protein